MIGSPLVVKFDTEACYPQQMYTVAQIVDLILELLKHDLQEHIVTSHVLPITMVTHVLPW